MTTPLSQLARREPRLPLRHPYLSASLALAALMVSHAVNGRWSGDFWEHSAVVRELAGNPHSPRHPLLHLDAPHPDYSPYTVGVAWLARAGEWQAETALAVAGIANLLLLLLGLKVFVRAFWQHDHVPFFTLLLTLFLWGWSPWDYSGFLHYGVLGNVLPYPSTFSSAVTLLALGTAMQFLTGRRLFWLLPLVALGALVHLSHPLTGMILDAGLVAFAFGQYPATVAVVRRAALLAIPLVSIALGLMWSYYPLAGLALRETAVYHESNRAMYEGLLSRGFPTLLALPPFFARIKLNRRDPLAIYAALLVALYGYGWVSHSWTYGRVLPMIFLLLHATLGAVMAREILAIPRRITAPALLGLALWVGINNRRALANQIPGRTSTYQPYMFLRDYTGQDDVVLSDIESSWIVPTFGGKVVAAMHPQAFVPDQARRREDVVAFFQQGSRCLEWKAVIEKYDAGFLLLNREQLDRSSHLWQSAGQLGEVVYSSDTLTLLRIARPLSCPPSVATAGR